MLNNGNVFECYVDGLFNMFHLREKKYLIAHRNLAEMLCSQLYAPICPMASVEGSAPSLYTDSCSERDGSLRGGE